MNAFFKASAIAAAAASLVTALPATAAVSSHPVGFTAPGEQTYEQGRDRYRYSREDYRRGYGYRDNRYRGDNYRNSSWRGNDGRYYCRRSNGTTGLLIGGAAGALLGREVDGGRDRTAGTLIGAAAGALLGREVDRGGSRCR
ncbi:MULTISPECIES: glycine zipper 2TM domain-containing protein [Novosphingobium]|jgi:hypothetical protein|uniref:17 kDa surface antigen n=1 Tax=Novosphingobium panipatense TaxID=428991 RepID=A0ABY1QI43_9SPHN|nr:MULTISPECIES: glycine zipper 2TM domain-containing protein [Novosphingobium]SMP69804.1 Glycine zipper 2TM domain-containing protein [Novosphingobium panipatense]